MEIKFFIMCKHKSVFKVLDFQTIFFRFPVRDDALEKARSAVAGEGRTDSIFLATFSSRGYFSPFSLKNWYALGRQMEKRLYLKENFQVQFR